MRIGFTELLVLLFIAGCSAGESPPSRTPAVPPAVSPPVSARAPDTTRVSCDSARVRCYTDTVRTRDVPYEPGEVKDVDWIVFAAAGDSITITATTTGDVAQPGDLHLRQGRDSTTHGGNHVVANDGVISVSAGWMDLMGELADTVPFAVQFRRLGAPVLQATGETATLTIESARPNDPFSIVPASFVRRVRDPRHWAVFPSRYKVALVEDSAYVVCRIPCLLADTVVLLPGTAVTRRY